MKKILCEKQKRSGNYEYRLANSIIHLPLHVKPIQSKKGGVTDAKLMINLR